MIVDITIAVVLLTLFGSVLIVAWQYESELFGDGAVSRELALDAEEVEAYDWAM